MDEMNERIRSRIRNNIRRAEKRDAEELQRQEKILDGIREKQAKNAKLHGMIDETFTAIFSEVDPISYSEKQVLSGYFHAVVTDVALNGVPGEIMGIIAGAIQFLMDTGRMSEDQEEELYSMMGEILAEG